MFANRIYCPPRLAACLGLGAFLALVAAQAVGPSSLVSLGLMTMIIFAAGAIPVRRMGEPEDVAHAVAYLLDRRSGFVTGQTLYVCGGMTVGAAGA